MNGDIASYIRPTPEKIFRGTIKFIIDRWPGDQSNQINFAFGLPSTMMDFAN